MSIVTKLFLFASAVVMAVFMSCDTRHIYPRSLLVADSLAECNADSALALLDTIADSAHAMPLQDSMYYALLRVKARDKAYQPNDTTDGILSIVSYYEHGGDRRLLPTAYYYAASAYRDMNKPAAALRYLYNAIDVAEEYGDVKIMSLCHAQIANLLYMNRLYEEALKSYREALLCDSMRGNSIGMMFDFRDLACCYSELGQFDSALCLFNKGLKLAVERGDESMRASISAQKARVYLDMRKYTDAERLLNVAIAYDDSVDRTSVLSIAARLYKDTNREAKAIECYKRLVVMGNLYGKQNAHANLSEFYSKRSMMDSATYHFRHFKQLTDSIDRIRAIESLAKIRFEEEYNEWKRESKDRYAAFLVTAVALIVAMLVFRSLKKHLRNNRVRVGHGMDEALDGADVSVSERKQRLMATPIVRKITRIKNDNTKCSAGNENRLTDDDWAELDDCVNKIYPGFKNCLLSKTRISEIEYHVCLLIKIDLQPAEIARLTFKEASTISNIRRRLFRKIFGVDGNGSDWDNFIQSL